MGEYFFPGSPHRQTQAEYCIGDHLWNTSEINMFKQNKYADVLSKRYIYL